MKFAWKCKHYQLKAGKWVPMVHLHEYVEGTLEVTQLLAPEGKQFDTEEQAQQYSEAMARKWLKDKYL